MPDLDNSFVLISPRSRIAVHSSGVSDKVRVGPEYQVDRIPHVDKENYNPKEEDLILWRPSHDISEKEIDNFISLAVSDYNYSKDQAYGLLYWHKMNIKTAKEDLVKYVPQLDLWSSEERDVFEKGLLIHGKDFVEIKKLLPDKSSKQIVLYYFHRSSRNFSDIMETVPKKPRVISPSRSVGFI